MATIIDGKAFAAKIRSQVKEDADNLIAKKQVDPCLAVVLVGENPASKVYVGAKTKMAAECNIKTKDYKLDESTDQETLLKLIKMLNENTDIHGILVQLPLPKQIRKQKIINAINPKKDVDGFHPLNVGNLASGYEAIIPCTPYGCLLLIKHVEKNLNGKHAVIIGRSNLNGKPMAQLLLKENCSVTIVHSKTKNIKLECQKADILIASAGVPNLVKADWVKKDAIVIDVGINKINGKIVGDVSFDEVRKKSKAITPVPGGVGPMTIACLLKNTVECFKAH